MFGLKELKPSIIIEENLVECPVKECSIKVERQRQHFRKEGKYKCPIHNIYISPSTFEYETELNNMLWTYIADIELFNNIKQVKRESRIARENSEDAVTWNVFRYLERNNLLTKFLSNITGNTYNYAELILWSYYQKERDSYSLLNKARIEFGEEIKRSSEPDIIVLTGKALFFIEAKVLAGNNTIPSDRNNQKKYATGGDNWFSKVFTTDYETVSIKKEKYELMRFWLLGTWMAKQKNLDFYLVNLVLDGRETHIANEFSKHIVSNQNNKFIRISWEDIYMFIKNIDSNNSDKEKITYFYNNKTLGYNSNHELIKAFNV